LLCICYWLHCYLLLAANIIKTITINPSATLKDKSAKCLTKYHNQKKHKNLNVPSKSVWEHYKNRAKAVKEVDTSLPASRWKEAQIEPTPIRCRELCYSCKVPWEPNHRCRGKGKVHIVEVHYDSEDEEMHEDATIGAYLEQSNEASDSYASDGFLLLLIYYS
jgi:hypothetical protein